MRGNDRGSPCKPALQPFNKCTLKSLIKRGCRLVEQHNLGILQPNPRPSDGLTLANRKTLTPIVDHQIQTLGVVFDMLAKSRKLKRLH